MKTYIIRLLLLFVIFSTSCTTVKFREDREEYLQELKGKVQQIKTEQTVFDDKKDIMTLLQSYLTNYNSNNQPLDETMLNWDNGPHYFYEYNEKGLLEKLLEKRKDSIQIRGKFLYDNKGNNIEYLSYDDNGKLIVRKQMKYDKFGNQTEEIHESFSLQVVKLFTSFTIDYKTRSVTIQSYKDGIRSKHFRVESYDKKGNMVKSEQFRDGQLSNVEYKKYDKNGNISEEGNRNEESNYIYKYQFDTKGNIIRQDVYRGDMLYSTQVFEITYRD